MNPLWGVSFASRRMYDTPGIVTTIFHNLLQFSFFHSHSHRWELLYAVHLTAPQKIKQCKDNVRHVQIHVSIIKTKDSDAVIDWRGSSLCSFPLGRKHSHYFYSILMHCFVPQVVLAGVMQRRTLFWALPVRNNTNGRHPYHPFRRPCHAKEQPHTETRNCLYLFRPIELQPRGYWLSVMDTAETRSSPLPRLIMSVMWWGVGWRVGFLAGGGVA